MGTWAAMVHHLFGLQHETFATVDQNRPHTQKRKKTHLPDKKNPRNLTASLTVYAMFHKKTSSSGRFLM